MTTSATTNGNEVAIILRLKADQRNPQVTKSVVEQIRETEASIAKLYQTTSASLQKTFQKDADSRLTSLDRIKKSMEQLSGVQSQAFDREKANATEMERVRSRLEREAAKAAREKDRAEKQAAKENEKRIEEQRRATLIYASAQNELWSRTKQLAGGLTDLARGFVLLTASNEKELEAGIRMVAQFEAVVSAGRGAVEILRSITKAQEALNRMRAAGAVINTAAAAGNVGGAAAAGGAAASATGILPALGSMVNPVTAATAAIAALGAAALMATNAFGARDAVANRMVNSGAVHPNSFWGSIIGATIGAPPTELRAALGNFQESEARLGRAQQLRESFTSQKSMQDLMRLQGMQGANGRRMFGAFAQDFGTGNRVNEINVQRQGALAAVQQAANPTEHMNAMRDLLDIEQERIQLIREQAKSRQEGARAELEALRHGSELLRQQADAQRNALLSAKERFALSGAVEQARITAAIGRVRQGAGTIDDLVTARQFGLANNEATQQINARADAAGFNRLAAPEQQQLAIMDAQVRMDQAKANAMQQVIDQGQAMAEKQVGDIVTNVRELLIAQEARFSFLLNEETTKLKQQINDQALQRRQMMRG